MGLDAWSHDSPDDQLGDAIYACNPNASPNPNPNLKPKHRFTQWSRSQNSDSVCIPRHIPILLILGIVHAYISSRAHDDVLQTLHTCTTRPGHHRRERRPQGEATRGKIRSVGFARDCTVTSTLNPQPLRPKSERGKTGCLPKESPSGDAERSDLARARKGKKSALAGGARSLLDWTLSRKRYFRAYLFVKGGQKHETRREKHIQKCQEIVFLHLRKNGNIREK